ncbi:hypothetical protein B7494_g6911 [Chlorociboria aeruginascens]|nr:hypothetical protein B7494_g6911 [Chlorociboria aeruginascens]
MNVFTLRKRLLTVGALSISVVFLLGTWLQYKPSEISTLPLSLLSPAPQASTQTGLNVTLRQGTFIGVEKNDGYPQTIEQFLGIPYALPPDGERRFKPPVPVEASNAVFDASTYGIRCLAGPDDEVPQGEACLTANIFRPRFEEGDGKIPVVVYVHGGSFNAGYGATRALDSLVAWSEEPLIGVSFNYRVGALGFLASGFIKREGALNLGLRDQRLLLEWVRENIAAFGGDVDNVTLMGNSAGAQSIGHHMIDTGEAPLFQRVILESGVMTSGVVYQHSNPLHELQFHQFLTSLGCENLPPEDLRNALIALPALKIRDASQAIWDKYTYSLRLPFQPVIDGGNGMIPLPPLESWKQGKYLDIPILLGYTSNEGSLFVPQNISTNEDFIDFFRILLPGLGEGDLYQLNTIYPDPVTNPESKFKELREEMSPQTTRLEQAYGHFSTIAPVRQTMSFAKTPPRTSPLYLYQFAARTSSRYGAANGDDGAFITFDKEVTSVSEGVREISAVMHAYWTSFVRTGDPNAVRGKVGKVEWPAYDVGNEGRMVVFGEGNDELSGAENRREVVRVTDDGFARVEAWFWEARRGLFEL